VALTRAPENVGGNHDIILEAPLTLSLAAAILTCYFSGVLVCISGFFLLFGLTLFLAKSLLYLFLVRTQSLCKGLKHRGTGVHIFGDAKNFCPNLILLSEITYKQKVLMLRLKRAIVN